MHGGTDIICTWKCNGMPGSCPALKARGTTTLLSEYTSNLVRVGPLHSVALGTDDAPVQVFGWLCEA